MGKTEGNNMKPAEQTGGTGNYAAVIREMQLEATVPSVIQYRHRPPCIFTAGTPLVDQGSAPRQGYRHRHGG